MLLTSPVGGRLFSPAPFPAIARMFLFRRCLQECLVQ